MDAFDLLGLPRRPWLDAGAVRAAFQERSRALHPDAPGGDAGVFADLNAAQAALARPADRLRLLAGEFPPAASPPDFDFGLRVGVGLREGDAALEKLAAAGNPLARALAAGTIAGACGEVVALGEQVDARWGMADERLRALDARWPAVEPAELAALAGEYTFLAKWREQLRERAVALAIARTMR